MCHIEPDQELYYSHDYGSCVTLTFAGPLAGTSSRVQCNSDNTITYGESCDQDRQLRHPRSHFLRFVHSTLVFILFHMLRATR